MLTSIHPGVQSESSIRIIRCARLRATFLLARTGVPYLVYLTWYTLLLETVAAPSTNPLRPP